MKSGKGSWRWKRTREAPTTSTSLTRSLRTLPCRDRWRRSEEHTSELQSPYDLVCRLLLEKKKLPTWSLRLVIALLLIGFPLALLLAWAYYVMHPGIQATVSVHAPHLGINIII